MITLLLLIICFLLSASIACYFSQPEARGVMLDHPNERSLHQKPISRNGGQAIIGSLIASLIILSEPAHLLETQIAHPFFLLALFLVASVSYLDDRFSLHPLWRILAHGMSALLLLLSGLVLAAIQLPGYTYLLHPQWAWVISGLFIIWMINLYNFMDGLDGLAGGMAVVGFSWMGLQGFFSGHLDYALINALIVSSSSGFLLFNYPPARIFMGDLGSSSLGLLASALILWGVQQQIFTLWQSLLVFSPFIMDATITLFHRLWRQEKIWQAHRQHSYQRLALLSGCPKCALHWEYSLMLGCVLSASITPTFTLTGQWVMLGSWLGIYSLQFYLLLRWQQHHMVTAMPPQQV